MVYLLDTHALLWFLKDDKQLSQSALNVIETSDRVGKAIAEPTANLES